MLVGQTSNLAFEECSSGRYEGVTKEGYVKNPVLPHGVSRVSFMKVVMVISILTVFLGIQDAYTQVEHAMSEMEWDMDRQGSDIKRYANGIDLEITDPSLCEEECAKVPDCQAWTYVKPNTVKGPRPKCFLKNFENKGVPNPKRNPACVSGKKE